MYAHPTKMKFCLLVPTPSVENEETIIRVVLQIANVVNIAKIKIINFSPVRVIARAFHYWIAICMASKD